jgi:hypothetical protein
MHHIATHTEPARIRLEAYRDAVRFGRPPAVAAAEHLVPLADHIDGLIVDVHSLHTALMEARGAQSRAQMEAETSRKNLQTALDTIERLQRLLAEAATHTTTTEG